jgi:predicted transcriptional regulator
MTGVKNDIDVREFIDINLISLRREGSMGQILVRKMDDVALERLRRLAEERNLSLEALAREALEDAARQKTHDELRQMLTELEAFRQSLPKSDHDSTTTLRALRNDDETSDD